MSLITKAMLEVHKKLNTMVIKTDSEAKANSYSYKYLSFDGLLEMIRPVLEENGLYLDQGTTVIDGRDIEVLKIIHGESGESTSAQCLIYNLKEDFRAWGAELSYKKRHVLLAKLGLHPGDDTSEDDPQPNFDSTPRDNTPTATKDGIRCISSKQAGLFLYKTNKIPAFRKKIIDQYGHQNNIPAREFSKILEDIETEISGIDTQETIDDTNKPRDLPF